MIQSTGWRATTFLMREFLLDVLWWPVWWYSRGTIIGTRAMYDWWRWVGWRIGLTLHARYLFRPMYGETGWQNRLISFGVRLVMLISRLAIVAIAGVMTVAAIVAWMILPILAATVLIRQLFP